MRFLPVALTTTEHLDQRPEALGVGWGVPPAHRRGEPSPSGSLLPLARVWHSRGVSADTTRRFAKTGTRAPKRFEGVVPVGTTVSYRGCPIRNLDPREVM